MFKAIRLEKVRRVVAFQACRARVMLHVVGLAEWSLVCRKTRNNTRRHGYGVATCSGKRTETFLKPCWKHLLCSARRTCTPRDKHAECHSVNARWHCAFEGPRQRVVSASLTSPGHNQRCWYRNFGFSFASQALSASCRACADGPGQTQGSRVKVRNMRVLHVVLCSARVCAR